MKKLLGSDPKKNQIHKFKAAIKAAHLYHTKIKTKRSLFPLKSNGSLHSLKEY